MSFESSQEVKLIKSQVDSFIEQEVKPLEQEYDQFLGEYGGRNRLAEDGSLVDEFLEVRRQIRRKSADAGILTMAMPEDVGGGGVDLLPFVKVEEYINDRHPDGFHRMMLDPGLLSPPLKLLHEDDYQQEAYFEPMIAGEVESALGMTEPDHGSDITWLDTTARKEGDEWVINGTKCFITNSTFSDLIFVFARTDGEDGDAHGISAFVVERDNPGWEIGKVQQPISTDDAGKIAFNHFNDCRVPEEQLIGEEGRGFIDLAIQLVGHVRLRIPARAVGRSQWMFDQCVEYAGSRRTFDEPIGTRQFVKGLLAEMRTDIEQVRWLYRHAALKFDNDEGTRWEQSAAKLRGAELWNDTADRAIQIHGGAGLMQSLPFEQEYRDARVTRVYDGTDEIHKQTIADHFLDI